MATFDAQKTSWTLDEVLHFGRRAGFGLKPEAAAQLVSRSVATTVDAWVDCTASETAFNGALPLANVVDYPGYGNEPDQWDPAGGRRGRRKCDLQGGCHNEETIMKRILSAALAAVVLIGWAASAATARDMTLHADTVAAQSTDSYVTTFQGGVACGVAVVGDGSTRLSLLIYDENGILIGSDTGVKCGVTWTPKWTGKFIIKVVNLGRVDNDYGLAVK